MNIFNLFILVFVEIKLQIKCFISAYKMMMYAFENDLKEDLSVKVKEIVYMLGPDSEDCANKILQLIICEGIYIHGCENYVK